MDTERTRVVSQAIDAAFSSCGAKPGDELTAEQILFSPRLPAAGVFCRGKT
jgi:hypothetical protein